MEFQMLSDMNSLRCTYAGRFYATSHRFSFDHFWMIRNMLAYPLSRQCPRCPWWWSRKSFSGTDGAQFRSWESVRSTWAAAERKRKCKTIQLPVHRFRRHWRTSACPSSVASRPRCGGSRLRSALIMLNFVFKFELIRCFVPLNSSFSRKIYPTMPWIKPGDSIALACSAIQQTYRIG